MLSIQAVGLVSSVDCQICWWGDEILEDHGRWHGLRTPFHRKRTQRKAQPPLFLIGAIQDNQLTTFNVEDYSN
jgi:hypothetical protein